MKGSANVEFILSIVLFVIVIAFVSINIIGIQPKLRQEIALDSIKSEAFRISDHLVTSALVSEPYKIDNSKAKDFFEDCKTSDYSSYVVIISLDKDECTQQVNNFRPRFTVTRNVLVNSEIKQLVVTVIL